LATGARFVSSLAQGLMRRRFAGLCVPEVRIASYLPSALTGSDHQRVLLSARDDLAVRSGSRHAVFLYQPLRDSRIKQRNVDFGSVLLGEFFKGTVTDKRVQNLELASRNPALDLRYRHAQEICGSLPRVGIPLPCHCRCDPLSSRRIERCTILLAKRH